MSLSDTPSLTAVAQLVTKLRDGKLPTFTISFDPLDLQRDAPTVICRIEDVMTFLNRRADELQALLAAPARPQEELSRGSVVLRSFADVIDTLRETYTATSFTRRMREMTEGMRTKADDLAAEALALRALGAGLEAYGIAGSTEAPASAAGPGGADDSSSPARGPHGIGARQATGGAAPRTPETDVALPRPQEERTVEAERLDVLVTAFEVLQARGFYLHDANGQCLDAQGFQHVMVMLGNAVLFPALARRIARPQEEDQA